MNEDDFLEAAYEDRFAIDDDYDRLEDELDPWYDEDDCFYCGRSMNFCRCV